MTTTSQMSIRVSNSRHMTSFAVSQTMYVGALDCGYVHVHDRYVFLLSHMCSVSLSSFLVCIYLASSTFREHADDELTSIYSREVCQKLVGQLCTCCEERATWFCLPALHVALMTPNKTAAYRSECCILQSAITRRALIDIH